MKKIIIALFFTTIILTGCSSLDSSNVNKEPIQNTDHTSQIEISKVKSKVQLYEGSYGDVRRFYGDNRPKNYCEVVISNVTDTSFDFAIYELVSSDKIVKNIIFLKNTAVFIDDGTKAAFYGKDYTLNFTFPNDRNSLPVVIDMNITGFEPLEGNIYVNNGIPGYEFN